MRTNDGTTGDDEDVRGAMQALLGDGRFLLALTGVALAGAGAFALFLCATGHFLPHDVAFLRMDARGLAGVANRELVDFMFHDRAAFGGALISIGVLYLWLVEFPLRRGEAWAWWTLAASGLTGFSSFLAYLAYGYLDEWHGVATLCLLPVYGAGMVRAWGRLRGDKGVGALWTRTPRAGESRPARAGRVLLMAYGGGLALAGAVISFTGMTRVFVATDLAYIGLSRAEICGVSERLMPLIAHDRAGFGGALVSVGLVVLAMTWHARATRSFQQAMFIAGAVGFATAIGVHFVIGYTDTSHLAPAFAGAGLFSAGWALLSFSRTIPGTRSGGAVSPEKRTADVASGR